MAYYSELKNHAKKEILDFPIAHLGFSPETMQALGTIARKIVTVKDLISMRKSDLRDFLLLKNPNYATVDKIISDIEECLAAIGVKLNCSSFNVYDVSSKRLGTRLYYAIIGRWPDAATIGEVSIIGNKRLKSLPVELYNQLVDKLDGYGIRIEGSGHTIVKSKIFRLPEIVETEKDPEKPQPEKPQPQVHKEDVQPQAEKFMLALPPELSKLPKNPTVEQIAKHNEEVANAISPDFYHKKLRDFKFKSSALASIKKHANDFDVCDILSLTRVELRTLLRGNVKVLNYLESYFESRGFLFKKIYKQYEKPTRNPHPQKQQTKALAANAQSLATKTQKPVAAAPKPASSPAKSAAATPKTVENSQNISTAPTSKEPKSLYMGCSMRESKIITPKAVRKYDINRPSSAKIPNENLNELIGVVPENLNGLNSSEAQLFKQKLAIAINKIGIDSLIYLDPKWFAPKSEALEYLDSLVYHYFSSKIESTLPSTQMARREYVKKKIAEEVEFYDNLVKSKQRKSETHSPLRSDDVTGSRQKQNIFEILNKFKKNPNYSGIVIPVRVKKYNPDKNLESGKLFADGIDIGYSM